MAFLPFYWGAGRAPIAVVEHGAQFVNPHLRVAQRLRRMGIWMRPVCACGTAAEIAVSDFMRSQQARRPHGRRLITIFNGVDTDAFQPVKMSESQAPMRIAAAGRLVAGKGFEDLIDAMAILRSSTIEPSTLSIAGDGPLRRDLVARSRAAGLAETVAFRGTILDMVGFWTSHDVACVPSAPEWMESFGLTAAEAQACGLPTVVTDSGALVDIVADGETGFVVPAGNAAHLAAALRRYVEHADLRKQHGEAARARALRTYSLQGTASRYAGLLRGLASA